MASILMPNDGTAKAWEMAPMVSTRTVLFTGTTISLSTPSQRLVGLSLRVPSGRVELNLPLSG
jgi:hypothetical protein